MAWDRPGMKEGQGDLTGSQGGCTPTRAREGVVMRMGGCVRNPIERRRRSCAIGPAKARRMKGTRRRREKRTWMGLGLGMGMGLGI